MWWTYAATEATYKLAMNPKAGTVVIFKMRSSAAKGKFGSGDLTPLHRFSDIMWLL